MRRNKYPHWVCPICGLSASIITQLSEGTPYAKIDVSFNCPTFHEGKCEVCGRKDSVTEARDFSYPDFDLVNHKKLAKKMLKNWEQD